MAGTLYVVATPIGNLEDISRRALRILSEVDLIASEDTRHTRKLLTHYDIKAKLIAYHEHNERQKAEVLVRQIEEGLSIALVSDAGTPGISDPGYHLVRRCRQEGVPVVPIPGPSAVTAALSASGLPTDQFYFAGFPPLKTGKRRNFLTQLTKLPATLIFYESPHRILKTLTLMLDVFGGRECVVARELTKIYEEFIRGSLETVIAGLSERSVKGEFVIMVAGAGKNLSISKK